MYAKTLQGSLFGLELNVNGQEKRTFKEAVFMSSIRKNVGWQQQQSETKHCFFVSLLIDDALYVIASSIKADVFWPLLKLDVMWALTSNKGQSLHTVFDWQLCLITFGIPSGTKWTTKYCLKLFVSWKNTPKYTYSCLTTYILKVSNQRRWNLEMTFKI